MITESLSKAGQHKHLQTLLNLSRFLEKNWKDTTKTDIERIISKVVQKYSPDGQETNTTHDHKKVLKIFFRWLKLGSRSKDEVGDPPETKNVKMKRVKDKIAREDLLTESDRTRILYACGENVRDRAFIDCLYDSGTRPGEILNLQIKHVKFDQHGIVLQVDGKTGARTVRLIEAIPNLSAWLNVHPFRDNPNAPLWITLNKAKYGQQLTYNSARQMVLRRCAMANLSKKVHLNLFRHSEATRTAKFMTEAHMKMRHGWTADSKQAARYVHLINSDVDDALFKHFGIKLDKEEIQNLPQICPICKMVNDPHANICSKCTKPLNLGGITEIDELQKQEIKKLAKQLVSEETEEWKEKFFDIQKEMVLQRSSLALYNAMKGIPTEIDLKQLESQKSSRKPEMLAWKPLLSYSTNHSF
ncbi:MAG: tyrosine-type recombinase/integrase [Thaumarchaeota archaeon]|nr:tyrosine-type recombinase/integrase [Nitrososphaerota archaeon]